MNRYRIKQRGPGGPYMIQQGRRDKSGRVRYDTIRLIYRFSTAANALNELRWADAKWSDKVTCPICDHHGTKHRSSAGFLHCANCGFIRETSRGRPEIVMSDTLMDLNPDPMVIPTLATLDWLNHKTLATAWRDHIEFCLQNEPLDAANIY